MSLIRPEVTRLIWRAREVIWGGAVAGFGIWLMALGGWLLIPVGGVIAGVGLILASMAFRRMRFAQAIAAPGLVELDEAQVGYLGPEMGGFLSLHEVVELRILTLRGRRVWRLKQADGQALLIPVDAAGAERLFDAFANLPGMEQAALIAALQVPGGQVPGGQVPGGQVPGGQVPGGQVPGVGQSVGGPMLPATAAAEMRLVWRRKGQGVVTTP